MGPQEERKHRAVKNLLNSLKETAQMDLEITCIQMTASEKHGTLAVEIGHCPPITEVCIITITFFITSTKRGKAIHLLGSDWAKEKDYPDTCNLNEVFLANKTFQNMQAWADQNVTWI